MRLFQSYFQTLYVIWQFANLEEPNELLVFPRFVCERFFCSDEFRKCQPHQQPKIPAKSKKDWTNNFSIIFAWEAMKMSLILLESVGSSAAVLHCVELLWPIESTFSNGVFEWPKITPSVILLDLDDGSSLAVTHFTEAAARISLSAAHLQKR